MIKRIVLAFALATPACLAWGGTFELSDPAAQFFEEEKQVTEEEATAAFDYSRGLRCTVDTGTGACTCVDKTEGQRVEMQAGQCEALVRSVLDRKEAGQ